jgi:hypothetical protein
VKVGTIFTSGEVTPKQSDSLPVLGKTIAADCAYEDCECRRYDCEHSAATRLESKGIISSSLTSDWPGRWPSRSIQSKRSGSLDQGSGYARCRRNGRATNHQSRAGGDHDRGGNLPGTKRWAWSWLAEIASIKSRTLRLVRIVCRSICTAAASSVERAGILPALKGVDIFWLVRSFKWLCQLLLFSPVPSALRRVGAAKRGAA